VASTDEYFEHNSESNACLTSDHTLNRLEKPRLGPEALKSILEDRADHHKKQRQELVEDYTTLFPHWMTLLCEGFSLFLCGVGSKKSLLLLFQEEMLCDFDHLVINGFFPSLTIKSILISILEEILELVSYPLNIVDQLKVIADHYSDPDISPLFLIINNLDGPMLRNEKAQHSLSQLASCKNIHIIASLDHINSPLIFDGNKYSFYNPLWWDTTTLAPYTEETSFENSLLVQQSGGLALSSLLHVFKSLTPNAKGIFILLAKYQLNEKSSSSTYLGMSFGDMYQRCRESFLVNSDLTLRAQLTEFKDHKLIKFRRGYDGSENLLIPLEDSTLQEFLDQYEES
ncbi:Origin recognition complex subunit 2, partial [Armadillidium nasatum]